LLEKYVPILVYSHEIGKAMNANCPPDTRGIRRGKQNQSVLCAEAIYSLLFKVSRTG